MSAGVGPTEELSLRVSAATLARVIFPSPEDGGQMLALEHKATLPKPLDEERPKPAVRAQPFGGALRLLDETRLQKQAGEFHFDSERSRSEGDFRLYIRPADWPAVREFCLTNLNQGAGSSLESSPVRELVEEFHDTLEVELHSGQYTYKPVGTVLEDAPQPSDNLHASGAPTVRIYRIFDVQIVDPALCQAMLANSRAFSSDLLRRMAMEDAQQGGPGRANAIFVAPLEAVRQAYLDLPAEQRSLPQPFGSATLHGNVPAILEDVTVPKYHYAGD